MPEDLADAILFLASDQSRYVNGEELKCDGGWTCFSENINKSTAQAAPSEPPVPYPNQGGHT